MGNGEKQDPRIRRATRTRRQGGNATWQRVHCRDRRHPTKNANDIDIEEGHRYEYHSQ